MRPPPLAWAVVPLLLLAGCQDGPEPVDAVHVQVFNPTPSAIEVSLVGGSRDDAALSGVGMSWPFSGNLEAKVFAGSKSSPQFAGEVASLAERVTPSGFVDDSDNARLANDLWASGGGEPLYGSDDIWRWTKASAVPLKCGGFYVLSYELASGGRTFEDAVDFRVPPC